MGQAFVVLVQAFIECSQMGPAVSLDAGPLLEEGGACAQHQLGAVLLGEHIDPWVADLLGQVCSLHQVVELPVHV